MTDIERLHALMRLSPARLAELKAMIAGEMEWPSCAGNQCAGQIVAANLQTILGWEEPMRRDDDLARQLMLEIEEHPDPVFLFVMTNSLSPEDRVKYFHLQLLVDAGFLEEMGARGGAFRLTNAGHDFLALTRKSETWEATKATASKLGGASLQMILRVAEGIAMQKLRDLGIPLG